MYLPPHFEEIDRDEIDAIVSAAPLACVVANTDEGLLANHLPLLAGPGDVLIGHVAMANGMHRTIADCAPVLAIFRGEHGYVSPNFYPTKQDHHRHVPTWNYEVVHMHGTIAFQHDTDSKRAAVGLLTRHHERRINKTNAWRMADAPTDYITKMLDGIVALRITVDRVVAKVKLSQNRDPVDYDGAVAGLEASGQRGIAARMARRSR